MKKIFIALLGASILAAPAYSMSVSEWEEYKKNCRDQGGTPGVHRDGSPGCHIGAVASAKNIDFNAKPKLTKQAKPSVRSSATVSKKVGADGLDRIMETVD